MKPKLCQSTFCFFNLTDKIINNELRLHWVLLMIKTLAHLLASKSIVQVTLTSFFFGYKLEDVFRFSCSIRILMLPLLSHETCLLSYYLVQFRFTNVRFLRIV